MEQELLENKEMEIQVQLIEEKAEQDQQIVFQDHQLHTQVEVEVVIVALHQVHLVELEVEELEVEILLL